MKKKETKTKKPIQFGEYQLCPMCLGNGWVFNTGLSTAITSQCGVCNGAKVLIKPILTP
jgi:uncharacterized protein (DUF983 family)